jgi:hypothetical protein
VSTDGSGRTVVVGPNITFLSVNEAIVAGSWIFYTLRSSISAHSLSRIKTDGSSNQGLRYETARHLKYADGWIYYSANYDSPGLCRIKTDGSVQEKLCNDLAEDIYLAKDWVYYRNFSDNNSLYRIKTDGGGRIKISSEDSQHINVVGDWVYYVNGKDHNIYKLMDNKPQN